MAYQPPSRNSAGVHWYDLRMRADIAYGEMHDEFCAAHYDYWQHGVSHPWGPFDVKPTPEETAAQFLDLQLMLEDMHAMMRHKINHRAHQIGDSGVIPQDQYRYDYIRDENGNVIEQIDKVQRARDRMAETTTRLGVKAKKMMDHYRLRIKQINGEDYDFPDWTIP